MVFQYIPPEWIQVILTGVLVGVTICYAYSTHKMAKASTKQIEYLEKENFRHLIIDMLKNTFWPINQQIITCKEDLEFRNINSLSLPLTLYLDEQKRPPDKILKKYNEKISDFSKRYDKLFTKGKWIIDHAFERYELIEEQFSDLCHKLVKNDDKSIYEVDTYLRNIFAFTLASSNLKETHAVHEFFTQNREILLKFLIENGFSEDINDYDRIKNEFKPLIDEFLKLLDNLFEDWKNEYNILDSDFKEPRFGYFES